MPIIKLSEVSEEKRKEFIDNYQNKLLTGKLGFKFLKPEMKFDEYGLRFPVEYLNKVGKAIIMFPLEIMADYADAVTKELIDKNDPIFNSEIKSYDCDEIHKSINIINATSIGNLAYACLYSEDHEVRSISEKLLNIIHSYMEDAYKSFFN